MWIYLHSISWLGMALIDCLFNFRRGERGRGRGGEGERGRGREGERERGREGRRGEGREGRGGEGRGREGKGGEGRRGRRIPLRGGGYTFWREGHLRGKRTERATGRIALLPH